MVQGRSILESMFLEGKEGGAGIVNDEGQGGGRGYPP